MEFIDLISIDRIFQAWNEFKKGKIGRADVQLFERHLEDNLFILQNSLQKKAYVHGGYHAFYVTDPKRRHIHKACVADRVIHHLLYTYLYDLFDKTFIFDSYSCRINKGTHKGIERLARFTRIVSKNYSRPCFTLKCDIKKFFASVDHETLETLLTKKISDPDILWLLHQVIVSFEIEQGEGIPLGNLTSQVFANIYMNELDQFMKHMLKVKYYLRYADDFIILSDNKIYLEKLLPQIKNFVETELKLLLHPDKIIFRRLSWGIDYLGYIVLPYSVIQPRTKTKRRMIKNLIAKTKEYNNNIISEVSLNQTVQSYLGYLSHANTFKLSRKLKNQLFFGPQNYNAGENISTVNFFLSKQYQKEAKQKI